MNKKIIISIILILILIILAILFIPKWKGKSADMNEIKENIKNKDTSFDFSNKYIILMRNEDTKIGNIKVSED